PAGSCGPGRGSPRTCPPTQVPCNSRSSGARRSAGPRSCPEGTTARRLKNKARQWGGHAALGADHVRLLVASSGGGGSRHTDEGEVCTDKTTESKLSSAMSRVLSLFSWMRNRVVGLCYSWCVCEEEERGRCDRRK